jgi:hypothetical protein
VLVEILTFVKLVDYYRISNYSLALILISSSTLALILISSSTLPLISPKIGLESLSEYLKLE